ncbi:Tyrosine-protein phosphatase 10D [Polyplax serrata]|uniref:protein-tyrosine-phosphatase n=1 Tax=Polyplax serrata TaxID=468196 RepID=A0AAN8S976_POLSC
MSVPFATVGTPTAEMKFSLAAELVIRIPENPNQNDEGFYRLDYFPRHGIPLANTTIPSKDIGHVIQFSQGLPGTKYEFWLYYTNRTVHDLLTWTASITTVPDPPTNLSVNVTSEKVATVSWSPPTLGHHTSYRLKVLSLSEVNSQAKSIAVDDKARSYIFRELIPGASYQVQLFTVFENKESIAYTSRNFTTKPNMPGKFIVWFRNETTLLVLWQPPYPPGIFSHYKVTIDPPDALESVLYVEIEGDPPGPAQAAFKGLVPGRAYNISVQTVSEDELSVPTTAEYRTVPLKPSNITFDKSSVTSHSFRLRWEPPGGLSEFDKYQVSINVKRQTPITRNRGEPTMWEFRDHLEPGKTYQVTVKTMSGKVASWPAIANITLRPLPVHNLESRVDPGSGLVSIFWIPDNASYQEAYKISYHEVETFNGDSSTAYTEKQSYILRALLPGRNYSITVQAVSNKIESNESSIFQATRPLSPVIQEFRPIPYGLNISWQSDVNSVQDLYQVVYIRNDTGEKVTKKTMETKLVLTDLYPGASYQVKVYAISHGLPSDAHEYFQTVFPHPPKNLSVERVASNSVVLKWKPPVNSIFTEYLVKYRTEDDERWMKQYPLKQTESAVTNMTPGEKYIIQVNTLSFGTESNEPLQTSQTVRPNPISNIVPIIDSTNVTLEWPRPEGRIESYIIRWHPGGFPEKEKMKNLTEQNVSGVRNNHVADDRIVRTLIDELMPGVKYFFEIYTISYSLESDIIKLSARTMPQIQSEVLVVNDQQETNSVTLRYTPTPQSTSHFDLYRFQLSDASIPVKEKSADDTETKVTFDGLIPGRLYNITVWTVSDGVASQPLQRQDRLYPESITYINATQITDTEITLKWDIPRGEYNAFEVQYLNAEGLLIHNLTLHDTITMTDLKPHRNYTFTVVVRSGTESSVLRRSLPVSAIFQTRESVPGKVERFHPVDIQPSDITFQWTLPSNEQNGVIRKFTITYGLEGSSYTQVRDFKPWEFQGVIKTLIPGKTYIFRIQAETKIGYGTETIWKQKMPILPPPIPSDQVVPTEVCRSTRTIQIRFRKNYFSEQNGAIIAYTVIVAEDDSKNSSGIEMPSWSDVQKYTKWPPYQVSDPYYPFKNSSVEDYTIGNEHCDPNEHKFCNGPLKTGTNYRVKVRAFTAPDKFTDTHYSFPIQTDVDPTPVALGVCLPIFGVLIAGLLYWIFNRRRGSKRRTTEARSNDNLSLPESVIQTSRPIRMDQFAEHYRIMSADSDFRFSEEFEELKHVGREQPCMAADLPCNRPKNRFTNILPYDHSRFKLQPVDDEEGSDYINANYVPGHNSPREFIVTQGPLHSTRDDFWRMVWESNSRAIVMLTRSIEKGREKCDHYWPYDTLPVYYGDISVTLLNQSHYIDWSITEFLACRGDASRVIRHFHFTTWPDFGVPSPPQTLVRFVRAFRERVGTEQKPIVVHCSAGVGRSGTFIALDRILQSMKTSDTVDIFGIVWQMRKERVWMVQTEQQYICIHQCLLAVLEGNENTGPLRQIHDNSEFQDDEGIAESGI